MSVWIWAGIFCGTLGFALLLLAVMTAAMHRKEAQRCTRQADGQVTGIAEQRPAGTREEGDVPPLALQAWGFAAGHDLSFIGNLLNSMSPKRFHPCVRFWADGKEQVRIGFVPTGKGFFQPGQAVDVRYDPDNPRCFLVAEAEPAAQRAFRAQLAAGVVLLAAAVLLFVLA